MPRALIPAIVVLALAAASLGAQQVTPAQIDARQAEVQKLLEAYTSGDHLAIDRLLLTGMIRGRVDPATRAALTRLLGDTTAQWSPARAAFTLEVAVAFRRDGFYPIQLVRLGQPMVIDRPNRIGGDANEDRFEVLWHQIALALLQSTGAWDMHTDYLATISPRVLRMAQVDPPVPNRMPLARAINAAMQCCRALASPLVNQMVVITSGRARPAAKVVTPDEAIALFEGAADDPSLHAEALVRGAFLESFLKRLPEALARLDRALPITDDTLAYAAALIRGGVLDGLGRPDEAAEAYGLALRLAPTMQTPAIGRAAALQRTGRLDEAAEAAAQARRLPAGGLDPWPIFIRADARFVDQWLVELRTLLR